MIAFFRSGYFPASGYRYKTGGTLMYVGNEVDSWSSSSSGVALMQSSYLASVSYWMNTSRIESRVFGFPVRCVQAFMK